MGVTLDTEVTPDVENNTALKIFNSAKIEYLLVKNPAKSLDHSERQAMSSHLPHNIIIALPMVLVLC